MTNQLRLLDGGQPSPWLLDPRTRRIGQRGVAEARRALDRALTHRDRPDHHDDSHRKLLRAG